MAKLSERLTSWLAEIDEDSDAVRTSSKSLAIITIGRTSLTLSPSDCEKAFKDTETVEELIKQLGNPDDAVLDLTEVKLESDVQDMLQEVFASVTEH